MDSVSIDSYSSWEQPFSAQVPAGPRPLPPPGSPTVKYHARSKHTALVRYQPPQVCGVLEVRKNAYRLGVTAIVRRETRELANDIEYPVVKYVVEDMSWPVFKRFGGIDILDQELHHLLESKSRWWTNTDDWRYLFQAAVGKSRRRTLFTFADPSVPTLSRAVLPAAPSAANPQERDGRVSDRIEELA